MGNNDLKTINISIPQTIAEQKVIVAKLDTFSEESNRLASIYQHELPALDELKTSLLHQAFTGQL